MLRKTARTGFVRPSRYVKGHTLWTPEYYVAGDGKVMLQAPGTGAQIELECAADQDPDGAVHAYALKRGWGPA